MKPLFVGGGTGTLRWGKHDILLCRFLSSHKRSLVFRVDFSEAGPTLLHGNPPWICWLLVTPQFLEGWPNVANSYKKNPLKWRSAIYLLHHYCVLHLTKLQLTELRNPAITTSDYIHSRDPGLSSETHVRSEETKIVLCPEIPTGESSIVPCVTTH